MASKSVPLHVHHGWIVYVAVVLVIPFIPAAVVGGLLGVGVGRLARYFDDRREANAV